MSMNVLSYEGFFFSFSVVVTKCLFWQGIARAQILNKPRLVIKYCLQFSILGILSVLMPIGTFFCVPACFGFSIKYLSILFFYL